MKRAIFALCLGAGVACASSAPPPADPIETASTTSDEDYPAPAEITQPDEPWRATPPPPGPSPKLKLPVFERGKLGNGLTVLAAELRALPLVSFVLVTSGGSAADPDGQGGLTALSYGLLGEGAGGRSALEFADAVADLGASFGTGADQDKGTISISGLVRNADQMLGLVADAAMRPAKTDKDFDRVKQQTLGSIVHRRGAAEGLAFEFVPAAIYGERHPYGHPSSGTEETVMKLKLKHVRRQLKRLLVPGASALIAVGDINLEEATALAQRHFAKWRGKRGASAKHRAVKAEPRKQIIIVHKDNSPQTMAVIGRPLFGQGDEDDIPLAVTNTMYGGSFSSRLNMNLREAKGYTYGAQSVMSLRHGVGAFLAYAKLRADVTAAGLGEFFSELEGMLSRPPDDTELALAKDGMIKSMPGAFEVTSAAASAATNLFVYDLPLDYYARRLEGVAAVGHDAVKAMATEYLRGDRMQIVLVGDASKITEPVRALGLGEPVVRHP